MYLLGEFNYIRDDDMRALSNGVRFQNEITKDDLVKSKNNRSYHIINLDNKKVYDPERNIWVDIRVGEGDLDSSPNIQSSSKEELAQEDN